MSRHLAWSYEVACNHACWSMAAGCYDSGSSMQALASERQREPGQQASRPGLTADALAGALVLHSVRIQPWDHSPSCGDRSGLACSCHGTTTAAPVGVVSNRPTSALHGSQHSLPAILAPSRSVRSPPKAAHESHCRPSHAEAADNEPSGIPAAESAPKEAEPEAHAGAVLRAIW